jgi:hypothetical protein
MNEGFREGCVRARAAFGFMRTKCRKVVDDAYAYFQGVFFKVKVYKAMHLTMQQG